MALTRFSWDTFAFSFIADHCIHFHWLSRRLLPIESFQNISFRANRGGPVSIQKCRFYVFKFLKNWSTILAQILTEMAIVASLRTTKTQQGSFRANRGGPISILQYTLEMQFRFYFIKFLKSCNCQSNFMTNFDRYGNSGCLTNHKNSTRQLAASRSLK